MAPDGSMFYIVNRRKPPCREPVTQKKKILIVSTSFPKSRGDGLSPFIWEFCLNLSSLDWDVTVLVPHHKGLPDSENWDGIAIRRFRYLPERFEDVGYSGGIMPNIKSKPWKVLKLPFYIFAMYREALRLTIDDNFDIVNFHWLFPASFWMGQFSRSSGVPVVMTGHGTDILMASKGIFKKIADRALPKAAVVTVNSEFMKSRLAENKLPAKTEAIFLGVDSEKFKPGNSMPSQSKTVLYVGRLIKQKGIDLLIDAFIELKKQFPDARLRIIGYGAEKENIQNIIKANNIDQSVTFTDMLPHDSLPEIYRQARVLVLPSVLPEGLGLTPAEAGLCGVPCITFGLGGTSEIVVNNKTGLIVGQSKTELADSLIRLFNDNSLTDELGHNAGMHLENLLSWPIIVSRYDTLFRSILGSRHDQNRRISKSGQVIIGSIVVITTIVYFAKLFMDRFERLLSFFK
jgi:glycosyltransferase involved in cell wall biosynthesis